MAQALREEGVYAVAIRPPTVPMGAARLRFSVMATHTEDDLTFALNAIERVGQRLNLLA
jgi:7-keto-8-aminopelargonate synthetase-like enzyme